MSQLRSLFGKSARWLSIISWIALVLALSQAIIPMIFIVYSGFIDDNAIKNLSDMLEIWKDYRHVQATINSFILSLIVSSVLTIISAVAALVYRWCGLTGNRYIYGISIIPLLIPDQVFGVAGRVVFDPSIGILAGWLPATLLLERFSALSLSSMVTIAKWLPAMIVVADSSILSMGHTTLFQVKMDFTSFLRAIRFVYLPQMKEVLFIIFSLGFLIGFRQHELAYELTSSGGGFAAETWSLWNYREVFEFNYLARAAIESLLILILLLIPILIIRRQAQNLSANEV